MFRSSRHGFREIFCFCTFALSARLYAIEGSSCPANWILFQGSCYFFSTHFTTWLTARELCKATGADLVTISSDFENAFVNSRLARSSCLSHTAWLGLHRHPFNSSRWVWLDNFSHYPEYTKWHRKEPMNDHLNKNCTSIHPDKSIFWYGTECTAQGCYVCLKDANECNETDTCKGQPCENIPGSYRCSCGKGYEKTNRETGCTGKS
ncbi:PREDICTED: perlucin-like protein [Acropora digitifera]|uniref:perlucin-like protein n=1 Tax=Acropora digitifera TaxID=70779 RepID=UPI00077AF7C2|nr:PREDICTED: perlucin-like protein [Acropora digitifera]